MYDTPLITVFIPPVGDYQMYSITSEHMLEYKLSKKDRKSVV